MAITGQSFGGFETNYLVTHTHIFSAALSGSGHTDLISDYGGLSGEITGSCSLQETFEAGQLRIGYSLWNRPELYIENSPVFKADQVTTPLLIMHNKKDPLVSWTQAVEFFTGLRRLKKANMDVTV